MINKQETTNYNLTAAACFDWNHKDQFYKRNKDDQNTSEPESKKVDKKELAKIAAITHGVVKNGSESAAMVLAPNYQHPLLLEREELRERCYHGKARQVLGKAPANSTKLPSFTTEKDFKFGDKTIAGESVGKIMYPKDAPFEDAKVTKQYLLSHKSYKPGEQKSHYGPSWKRPKSPELSNNKNDTNRVSTALFWGKDEDRFLKRPQAIVSQITDHVSSQAPHLNPDNTIYELMGNSAPTSKKDGKTTKKWKLPAAGRRTIRADDLDLQKHIIPRLNPKEDAKLVRKITEDKPGGTPVASNSFTRNNSAYGLRSVRDSSERNGRLKGLADKTCYNDELGAQGLISPTARNIYGKEQLERFYTERLTREMVINA